jgi:hypothetical protein
MAMEAIAPSVRLAILRMLVPAAIVKTAPLDIIKVLSELVCVQHVPMALTQ